MSASARSLRSTLTWATLLFGGCAVVAALAVVALTTQLHRASAAIETSTQSVHVVQEAEIDLLLHARAKAPLVRRDLAARIQRRLAAAEAYLANDHERLVLDETKARVQEYLVAADGADRVEEEIAALLGTAYSALEGLATMNVAQAAADAKRAARIDGIANVAGMTVVVLVLGAAAFFIYWVRGPLIRPVLDLAQVIDQFGHGDLACRAPIAGPRELKEMAARFNEMAAQLERQKEQQRAFLAGVAHDLRNPVSALLLSAEATRADASLPPDHRARRSLDRTVRQLRKLDRMIADFLDVAMLEQGSLEVRLELCDLGDVVRSAMELFEGTSSQHALTLALPQEPIPARIDPLRMEQVIGNLISNAIKYSPDGGKVEIHLGRQQDEIMLAVTDHGLGMPADTQSHLFQPFRRGLSRQGIAGAGLGLFVARRIVEAHQGRIEVETSLGTGSTFRVFLPSDSENDVGLDSGNGAERREEGQSVRPH